MTSLLLVVSLGLFVCAFGAAILFLSSKLGPKKAPNPAKDMPYESGIPGQETRETKISVKFYLTAILFILFDIEIIFMYPWAIRFFDSIKEGNGLYMLGAMGVFVLLFVIGLFWEVKSKALEWE